MWYRNLDEFWFGWMEVGFDWWIMFGMMFGVVWVKKFVIWWRFEGDMKVWRFLVMQIFREWFEGWEIFVMKNEGRRKEKKIRYMMVRGLARAVPTYWIFVVWKAWSSTAVPLQAWAVPRFWHFGLNFFSPFSWILLRQLPTKQLKTNKKAIKCVGCLPRSARLESLDWRLESVLRKDQRDHIV